ncbi:hypothetical protein SLS56_007412 [Neofusicoccum ribis]|uniref:Uncharacterized protein n=1 Tax=Neofusicoccum ribis TaxID=45134 RepID=A0ABR3SPN1_9PEZI
MAPIQTASPILAPRGHSAPATPTGPAFIKAMMEIANIVNPNDEECEDIPTPPPSPPTDEHSPGSAHPDAGPSTVPTEDEDISYLDDDNETGGDPSNPEFECWVMKGKRCTTGQSTLALSRKMVSDYFGRNKKETAHIEAHRWLRACRKHYQRKSYQGAWRHYKGTVVLRQLALVSAQEPGLRYCVTLKASEERRLQAHYGKLMAAGRTWDPADPEVAAVDPANPDHAPLAVLRDIKAFVDARKVGPDGEMAAEDCEELVTAAVEMVKQGRCTRLPLFEMLPLFAVFRKQAPAAGVKRKGAGGQGGAGAAKRRMV